METVFEKTIPKSDFTAALIVMNRLAEDEGFGGWHFKKGMQFNECEKWWVGEGDRTHAHEGVDFCFYKTKQENIKTLCLDTLIPPLYGGEIVSIFDDFIAKSILVRHQFVSETDQQLYGLYGHLDPLAGICAGGKIRQGEQIATIADTAIKKRAMLPHLHISTIWLPPSFPAETFRWEIGSDPAVTFCDPLLFI